MREFIDIVSEGDVIPFPNRNIPVNPARRLNGGASIHTFGKLPDFHHLNPFTQGYIEAALWTDEDELESNGIAEVTYSAFHIDSVPEMVADCDTFQRNNAVSLEVFYDHGMSEKQAGHDFWLTRNRHGAGFWDRGVDKDISTKLTKAAQAMGEVGLYAGDDKSIRYG